MSKPLTILDIVPKDPRRRTAWVKYQLQVRGSSFARIAAKLQCSRRAVSYAMSVPSYRQEKAIAEELGLSVSQLFPERYDASGRRLHHVRVQADDNGHTPSGRNVESRGRA